MRNLHLDFIYPYKKNRYLNLLLIGIGLTTLTGALLFEKLELEPKSRQLNSILEQQQKTLTPKQTKSPLKPEEIALAWKKVSEVSEQLQIPWSTLFSTIGKASSADSIAYLTIEPDSQKGQIIVEAEARYFDSMLDFFQAMQESDIIEEVTLLSHSINKNVREKPIHFRLSARWSIQ